MADKVYVLLIKVDLDCCRCRRGIQEHLCKIQHKERIVAIIYDEKNNVVQVSGPFNPEQLKRKLLCKLPKIIKCIDIIDPSKPKEKEKETPKPPPKDENKERFMRCCEEEYEEITKELEKCKKACEEKCKKDFEDRLKRKCKCKCECDCKEEKCKKEPPKKEEPKKEEPKKEEPKKEPPKPSPPPPCMWPPQVKMVCCARPCPCFEAWSSNYRCCSCGVVSWPSGSGSGSGSGCQPGLGWGGGGHGPGSWGRPSQWGCEPGRAPNIVVESSPPCTIM